MVVGTTILQQAELLRTGELQEQVKKATPDQLKQIFQKLVKSNRKVEADLGAANRAVRRLIASTMLEAAHSSRADKARRLSPEEANLLAKWNERFGGAGHYTADCPTSARSVVGKGARQPTTRTSDERANRLNEKPRDTRDYKAYNCRRQGGQKAAEAA
ncbi:hypothetical protein EMWEY_00001590 [Eimeria maxima]|uniref:Uncharacterized protein n=1 Tax=Eimeria maxima TaxID=5804 RepID=U6M7W5_EIMMA|nr:hypothetical protein EMWEY_00001590 [Eimeria maxima]CDJ57770.1 hypothetical protein EMWEY_00001590 [Eimeria maxima]